MASRPSPSALGATPRATDGTHGGPNQRGSSGDLMLPSAVAHLLPTPTATPYGSNQSLSPGSAVRPSLGLMASTGLTPRTPRLSPDGSKSSDDRPPVQLTVEDA